MECKLSGEKECGRQDKKGKNIKRKNEFKNEFKTK